MNTDDLIKSLGSELTPVPQAFLTKGIAVGLAGGVCVAIAAFALLWEIRSDLVAIATDPALLAKTALPLALACLALPWMRAEASPGGRSITRQIIGIVPVALALLVVMTLLTTPAAAWPMEIRGKSIATCLVSIPALSLPILVGLMAALRRGAPEHPALCGALAGLAAGAIAATVYSLYCVEDSPLFYSVWYSTAVLGVACLGAALGRQILIW